MSDGKTRRVATGVPGFDEILHGGLPENRVYLIEGDSGTGKTTMAIQFLLEGARRGERGLHVALSESKSELESVAASHGWSLEPIDIYEFSTPQESLEADSRYTLFHPAEVELGETIKTVLEEFERVKPYRMVFDSLSEMRLLAGEPLRYRRQILALKQFFAGKKCTVLLLDDRPQTSTELQVQSICHGAIRLDDLAFEFGPVRRRLHVQKLRGVDFASGYHDFVIRTGGIQVYPRLEPADFKPERERHLVPSGLRELDDLLGGGLERGTSVLITGPAGAGKTLLSTQYAIAAAERGERSALFLFDENLTTVYRRSASLGLPLDRHIESGKVLVRQVDPGVLTPGELVHDIRTAVERDGARIVVIDSLNGYLSSMPEERFLTIQLHELHTYLAQKGVLSMLTISQYGVIGSTSSPIEVSYLADTVILLRYFEAAGEVRQAISVVKKGYGAHERTIRELQIQAGGIRVGPTLEKFKGVLGGIPESESLQAPPEPQ
jgi:circadian clock protein KaiC